MRIDYLTTHPLRSALNVKCVNIINLRLEALPRILSHTLTKLKRIGIELLTNIA